ncbi:hypothetical protein RhiirA5_473508 [Rhizophagus irregularis]|uniref:Uncharacterized protein n=3 Tax=Rhizophagus irregularis TaxID=588596 RepID=U9TXV6_RHIID|nr:hypothetical protein GLOIN_2v1789544 [Rhizophagus irregularis DAOM 181602=DAOM 197198]EXX57173.1 hypothetical protein RirG_209570 [Rhizophagus irregularis DAOM 197198w]PKC09655.1 hypothetical protein RhiirA5_473508 [Rhizophagus irregularis]PKC64287.1 hypothetical protein RhiirA1_462628 [Rhizophagus irregularis]POG59110.1 hypothetical protein GLOIN_2v1789544 [Rhizophagus irregularis DAOM 181602=DAOM 197198]UZO20394.1 hypothetical protein OCT59_012818 [Rhizophagus irregularis]|eukprot:XP_025165976.1 hypothetical protein GLOIN_2v1789544 [Rhizophagus irregularis DAOM 181602=DAOM 197198]
MNTNEININNRLLPPSICLVEKSLDQTSSDEDDEVKLPPHSKCRDSPISSEKDKETYNEEELHSNGYLILATTMPTVDKNVKSIKLIENREFLEFLIEFHNIHITINVLPSSEEGEEIGQRVIYFNEHRILITTMLAENNVINTTMLGAREFLIEFEIFIAIRILEY